jgi:hypothetical protein
MNHFGRIVSRTDPLHKEGLKMNPTDPTKTVPNFVKVTDLKLPGITIYHFEVVNIMEVSKHEN